MHPTSQSLVFCGVQFSESSPVKYSLGSYNDNDPKVVQIVDLKYEYACLYDNTLGREW